MNRIDKLFSFKNKDVLSVYVTAGFPELENTFEALESLQRHGADMIELGIPFSDPIADGPVIQSSSKRALENGMTLSYLFSQLDGFRDSISVPVILMGYINSILQYGVQKFCMDCKRVGIDGVILPDLPLDQYRSKYKDHFKEAGIKVIMLVTPNTLDDRIREISSESGGFIYAVSTYSTTGGTNYAEDRKDYFKRINSLTVLPVMVGFGVSDRESFLSASRVANGAIIGSAYIKAISKGSDIHEDTASFLNSILQLSSKA